MSTDEIKHEIKEARPKLSTVAPLSAAICWGYVGVNFLLGLGMIFLYKGTPKQQLAVVQILSFDVWGAIFIGLAVVAFWALVTNNWKLARNMQLAGLFVKAVWAVALIFRCFVNPNTIIITLVWLFFAYIQAVLYVHFIPRLGTISTGDNTNDGTR